MVECILIAAVFRMMIGDTLTIEWQGAVDAEVFVLRTWKMAWCEDTPASVACCTVCGNSRAADRSRKPQPRAQ